MTVYFMQRHSGGPVKIGKSRNVRDRLRALQYQVGEKLKVLGVLDGYTNKERELHERFSDFNVESEWFEPVPELLEFIEKNADEFDIEVRIAPRRKKKAIDVPSHIKVKLFDFWQEQEKKRGRVLTIAEVSRGSDVSRDTITRLLRDEIPHPSLIVINKLCKYFEVPTGPIPFLVYEED